MFLLGINDNPLPKFRLIPLENSLFHSLEKDSKKTVLSQIEISNTLPTAQKSRVRDLTLVLDAKGPCQLV